MLVLLDAEEGGCIGRSKAVSFIRGKWRWNCHGWRFSEVGRLSKVTVTQNRIAIDPVANFWWEFEEWEC
jgi:hypothetical protein